MNFLIRDFENRLSSVARRKTFVIYGFSFIQIRQEDFETVIEKLHMFTYVLRNCPVFSGLYFFLAKNCVKKSFLSSPIECVAFERLELLRTEIHAVFFPHLSFLVSELFLVPMVFISTYGMYKYLWYV